MQNNPTVKFQKINPSAVLPKKAHSSDAAYDLVAVSFEKKDFTVVAHTGLRMALPPGYEAEIRSRSGLSNKGIVVANSPGTMDNGYRGEVDVILASITGQAPWLDGGFNKSMKCGNTELRVGDRVAQLLIRKSDEVTVEEVENINEDTDRGSNGLGSTGV